MHSLTLERHADRVMAEQMFGIRHENKYVKKLNGSTAYGEVMKECWDMHSRGSRVPKKRDAWLAIRIKFSDDDDMESILVADDPHVLVRSSWLHFLLVSLVYE